MAPETNGAPGKFRQYPPFHTFALLWLPLIFRPFGEQLLNPVERVASLPENPYAKLISDQSIAIIPSFTLESGVTLYNVPVAYTTRGEMSPNRDNVLVICHALSGSADVADWWGPLLGGPGQAFDTSRFFVICLNSLGSPYGSASAVTYKDGNPEKGLYGPEFPLTTVRDDVRLVGSYIKT
jgi:homoserine O-acetyltransferase